MYSAYNLNAHRLFSIRAPKKILLHLIFICMNPSFFLRAISFVRANFYNKSLFIGVWMKYFIGITVFTKFFSFNSFFFSFSISANKLVVGFAYKFQFVISKLNYIHGRTTRFGHTTPMLLSISSSPNVIIYRRNEMDFNWRNVESVPVERGLLGQRILTKKKNKQKYKTIPRVIHLHLFNISIW